MLKTLASGAALAATLAFAACSTSTTQTASSGSIPFSIAA